MEFVVDRIKKLMSSKDMSASEFADLIGVKKANVSHVLSGRNKPSLEFVLRVCQAFDDVDPNLLLLPELNREGTEKTIKDKFDKMIDDVSHSDFNSFHNSNSEKRIERIVIFYKDKTFTEYRND